jgi:hypothetical protein
MPPPAQKSVSKGPTYTTTPQTSKKYRNTPSKLYGNQYKTTNSVRTYLPVSEPFA